MKYKFRGFRLTIGGKHKLEPNEIEVVSEETMYGIFIIVGTVLVGSLIAGLLMFWIWEIPLGDPLFAVSLISLYLISGTVFLRHVVRIAIID